MSASVQPGSIVELRIHGVSGTPPESMLRTGLDEQLTAADVEQVAGDALTGFYRVTAAVRPPDHHHLLEAYNWGQLTSGTWKKALWLLLVPFGLLNAAHFMLPKPTTNRRSVPGGICTVAEALLRMLGVLMTASFALGVAATVVDLVGWQWTSLTSSGSGATGPRFGDPRGWLAAAMVVAGLIPMAILWFGGARSAGAGEPVAPVPPAAERPDLAGTTGMTGPEFDVGYPNVASLQRIHLAVVAVVLAHLGFSIYHSFGGATSGLGRWLADHGTACCAVLLVLIVVLATLFGNPHRFVRAPAKGLHRAVVVASWLTLAAALGLWLVAGICVLAARSIPPVQRGPLPGLPGLCNAAMVVGLAGIVLFALTNAVLAALIRQPGVPRPFRRYLAGMVGTIMAAMGVFVGVGLAAATVFGTRYALLRTTAGGSDLRPPLLLQRVAHAWGVTAVELVAIGAVLLALWGLQRGRFVRRARIAHNVHPYADTDPGGTDGYAGLRHPCDLTPSAVAHVATAWWLARIKYHLQWILGVLAAGGLLLALLTAFAVATDNDAPVWGIFFENAATACVDDRGPAASRLVGWTVSCTGYGGPFFVTAGSAVLLGLSVVLVYLGRKSISDNALRRAANVVWDIIAFWPRAAHPLVPAPYTAKALDELRRRIYFHLARCAMPDWHRATGRCTCAKSAHPVERVVLAPHSQGSLLAVAAIAGLRLASATEAPPGGDPAFRPITPGELGMVTYGSQLQFAYARAFPAYVNYRLITSCVDVFSDGEHRRWINVLRETDPIGGQVFSDDRDDQFRSRTLRTGFDRSGPGEQDTRWAGKPTPNGVRVCGDLEWRLLDPVLTDGQREPRSAILAHSDYFCDPVWPAIIAEVSAARTHPDHSPALRIPNRAMSKSVG